MKKNKPDTSNEIIVVGAGFAGSVMARLFAEQGNRVKIVERRDHIAGNMYDYVEDGIRIQRYGPHTFHTNMSHVYDFLARFCTLDAYQLKCEAVIDGVPTPSPFNFKTIDQFCSEEKAKLLKRKLVRFYGCESATVLEMLNCEDQDIRKWAEFLYAKDYQPYTAKQWGKMPEEIDSSVLKRVPVVFNYKDTYFYDKYEAIPRNGFTDLFKKMLRHPNIQVELNTDALMCIEFNTADGKVVYDGKESLVIFTGAIDELFGYRYGYLPYRSLYFEYEKHSFKSYQGSAIVAHPTNAPYTRITEYTKLPYQNVGDRTVIVKEYSVAYAKENERGNEPFYPVLTDESQKTYTAYKEYAEKYSNLVLCGRLADFKYYNMDMVINRTFQVFKEICREKGN